MVDVLTPEQRRYNMSRIKGGDTKPEMTVRRALHERGFRYRLHRRDLPGCPDLVLSRYHVVIFVHGCFWHGHDCHLVKKPTTRAAFWESKLGGNAERDKDAVAALQHDGWRVVIVWECALRGSTKQPFDAIMRRIAQFITATSTTILDITGAKVPRTTTIP
jgi:DNA mismatch endonuclease (patch repair protein)